MKLALNAIGDEWKARELLELLCCIVDELGDQLKEGDKAEVEAYNSLAPLVHTLSEGMPSEALARVMTSFSERGRRCSAVK